MCLCLYTAFYITIYMLAYVGCGFYSLLYADSNHVHYQYCRDVGSTVGSTSGRGPKTYDEAGGTDPDRVRDGCMTDGIAAVIGDCCMQLRSGMGLVSSNGQSQV